MYWKIISSFLLVMTYINFVSCSNKEKSTEKPNAPPFRTNPDSSKRVNQPTHISEFTNPDTGKNPFLDLEEGLTSLGRNVMEDERRNDDDHMMDFDVVEGETNGRKWGFDYYEKPLEKPARWPGFEDKDKEPPTVPPTFSISQQQQTTTSTPTTIKVVTANPLLEETVQQNAQNEEDSLFRTQDMIIYASATTAAVATVALLAGACWWKRKSKRMFRSPVSVEEGVLKS